MKASPASARTVVVDVDRAGRRLRHQPGRRGSRRRRGTRTSGASAWPYVPLRSRPWVIPIWISGGGRRPLEVAQLEGGRGRPRGIVLVGDRRPEHAVQVRALVAEGQLEDVAAVAGHDPLGPPHEVVELLDGGFVVVVVDAAEAEEDRERRPELGEELAAAGAQALVDLGQEPRPDERPRRAPAARRRAGVGDVSRAGAPTTPKSRPVSVVEARLAELAPARRARPARTASSTTSPFSAWCSASARSSMRRSGEDVDQLDRRDRRRRSAAPVRSRPRP